MKNSKEEWDKMQSDWRAADAAVHDYQATLTGRTSKAENIRYYQLCKARERVHDKIYKWLAEHSPRDWERGVPMYYAPSTLTYEDATTDGPLSVVPPPAGGYSKNDMVRFAQSMPTEKL